jgi:hypothetical protein
MLCSMTRCLTLLAGLALLGGATRAAAAPIFEPNNTKATATVLTPGTLVVNDSLNANVGRPDTVLGHYDPAYSTLLGFDDNDSPLGNGFASRMEMVPLELNGSAYFRVTGANDFSFIGAHTQLGKYYVQFDLYDSDHVFFKTLSLEFEHVSPGMVDNIWIDPPTVPEPERAGGFVTATVQNIVGPGSGDSVDFFLFTGLVPNVAFTAVVSNATFDARLGWFGGPSNALLSANEGAMPTIAGTADALGRALLAVSGAGDANFGGVHAKTGTYTLTVLPMVVPEPGSLVLAAIGALGALVVWRRRRR